jgi:ribonuclease E
VIEGPPADVWVELPAQDEAPKKARRPRSRGRKTVDAEALAETAVEAPVAEAPSVETVEETPLVAAEVEIPAPVAEPEPVAAVESAPVAVEPDPAEIVTPPEKPKRGWWRRG